MQKDTSPFTPGSPVGFDLFAGRAQQIEEVERYVRQAGSGRQENVFLTGDRGIGKSSFATVVRGPLSERYDMQGVHVHLGGATTVEEAIRRILESLFNAGQSRPWFDEIVEGTRAYIRQVGLFGVTIAFHPPADDLTRLTNRFADVLGEVLAHISEDRRGVAIVLDDINGLADTDHFARWYKSTVDYIATHFPSFPALLMVSGIPERRDRLAQHEPSLMRVFRPINLDRLSDDEVSGFFTRAFEQASMKVSDEALSTMVHFASGLPVMMQEIGDATFWTDTDGTIDRRDAVGGLMLAADNVGHKYLAPRVYSALRSKRYHSIIRKIADSIDPDFTRQEIASKLTNEEMKVFDNLLRRLRELDVVQQDPERGRGAYRYTNQIYPVYMYTEAQRASTSRLRNPRRTS